MPDTQFSQKLRNTENIDKTRVSETTLNPPKKQEALNDPKSHWVMKRSFCHYQKQTWGDLLESVTATDQTDVNARLTRCYAMLEKTIAGGAADVGELRELISALKKDVEIQQDTYLQSLLHHIEKRFENRAEAFPAHLSKLPTDQWLDEKGLSKEGLSRFIMSLQPSGADGAGLYLWEAGELQTIFESSAAWSMGSDMSLREMKSSTKSVAGLLFFIAAARSFIDLDKPVTEILNIPELYDERWKRVTSRHLLNQASGLKVNAPSNDHGDALEQHLRTEFGDNPEEYFCYSNAGSQLLGFILNAALKTHPSYEGVQDRVLLFARHYLFHPLGISDEEIRFTYHPKPHEGVPFTSYGIHATPFAFAQFAQVLLCPGELLDFDKQPVLTETELKEILTPTAVLFNGIQTKPGRGDPKIYGNCFFLTDSGIETRGECETDMCLVSQNDNLRNPDGSTNLER